MTKYIDYIEGQKMGCCIFIKENQPTKRGDRVGLFKCGYCGGEFTSMISIIKMGRQLSFGCLKSSIRLKHGYASKNSKNKTYNSWLDMRRRCYSVKNKSYKNYGGRGIYVCDRWLGEDGFSNFLADMGEKPTPKHELDRFPNNETGIYEPSNCRWALPKEQSLNRRSNRFVFYKGQRKLIYTWCEELGLNQSMVNRRFGHGWPPSLAFTLSPGHTKIEFLMKQHFPISYSFGVIST